MKALYGVLQRQNIFNGRLFREERLSRENSHNERFRHICELFINEQKHRQPKNDREKPREKKVKEPSGHYRISGYRSFTSQAALHPSHHSLTNTPPQPVHIFINASRTISEQIRDEHTAHHSTTTPERRAQPRSHNGATHCETTPTSSMFQQSHTSPSIPTGD